MPSYRRDIDGLRAIAVVSVVLFHAGVPGFGGGFLGVDVFFVISGFLITGILSAEGGLDLARFYERRIRRIVPALVLVLAAATLAGLALLSPFELKEYARSLLASTVFGVNFYFTKTPGYFTPRFATPLLHLWSLSVEEQFYIVYPLFLFTLRRWAPKLTVPALTATFLFSLALSTWLCGGHKQQAFYFAGSRAFELMLGALVAVIPLERKLPKAVAEAVAVLGLVLILLPGYLNSSKTLWPGLHALAPCIGTALLLCLHAGHDTLTRRLLSTRGFVGLGLISYSLYLWHWPLFQFYTRWILRTPTADEYGALIAVAIVTAALSWRYVEQPLRRIRAPRTRVFGTAAVIGVVFLAIGGATVAYHGFAQRFTPDVRRIYDMIDFNRPDHPFTSRSSAHCFVFNPKDRYPLDFCFHPANGQPNVLIWGDSLGHNIIGGLSPIAEKSGVHIIEATFAGCRPATNDVAAKPECRIFNRAVYQHVDYHIDTVILTARFFTHEEGVPIVRELAIHLAERGIKVMLLGPQPEYPLPLPLVAARYPQIRDARLLTYLQEMIPAVRQLDNNMRATFSGIPNVTYISALDAVCGQGPCPILAGQEPYAFDERHLTAEGSALIGAALWPQIAKAMAKPPLPGPPNGH